MTDLMEEILKPIVDKAREEGGAQGRAMATARTTVAMAQQGIPLDSICAVTELSQSTVCDILSNAGVSLDM